MEFRRVLFRSNARLMGARPTGNGRRESFAHLVMPRMTNTYMLAGTHDPEEMIRSVKRGLYAVNFGGGQVDITGGKYVFSATEAYLDRKSVGSGKSWTVRVELGGRRIITK